MDPVNLAQRLPGKEILYRTSLQGYRRSFTKTGDTHLYLNLVPARGMKTIGVVFAVNELELAVLKKSEPGYDLVDVTGQVDLVPHPDARVFAFIAPPYRPTSLRQVKKSYLDKCLNGVPPEERDQWLLETEMSEGTTIDETK